MFSRRLIGIAAGATALAIAVAPAWAEPERMLRVERSSSTSMRGTDATENWARGRNAVARQLEVLRAGRVEGFQMKGNRLIDSRTGLYAEKAAKMTDKATGIEVTVQNPSVGRRLLTRVMTLGFKSAGMKYKATMTHETGGKTDHYGLVNRNRRGTQTLKPTHYLVQAAQGAVRNFTNGSELRVETGTPNQIGQMRTEQSVGQDDRTAITTHGYATGKVWGGNKKGGLLAKILGF